MNTSEGSDGTSSWQRWKNGYMGRLVIESVKSHWRLYILAVTAMIIVAVTTAGTALIMENIIDALADPEAKSQALLIAGAVVGLFALKGCAAYVQAVSLARAGNRIVATQQDRLYKKLLGQGVTFFQATESSNLLMRMTRGAQSARQLINIVVTGFVRDALTLIGLVAVMIYQQPLLSMISLIAGPLAVLGVRVLLKRVKAIMEAETASQGEIIKVLQETAFGIEVIKVFGLENRMSGRMSRAISDVESRANAIARLQSVTSPLMEVLAGCAIAGVLVFTAFNVTGGAPTTPGQLMSFVTALVMAYEPAKRLSRMRIMIESQMVGVSLMFTVLDREEPLFESADAMPLSGGPGRIEVQSVTYGYRPNRPVIEDLDLVCEAGKSTALVGPSGGGKSTIFGLILRFFDPDAGKILIDGKDLRDLTFESLRSSISYVGQNTFLFATSVKENLRYAFPGATDEDVIAAAKAASAHEFITALPKGYDTRVGENGAFLSGGQKQRIAIARAILRDSPILLLDEATSALDTDSEASVKTALSRLTEGRTTVIIAHRLSTVLEADKIYVIDQGRVVEEGAMQELLAADGLFQKLFERQFQGESQQEADPENA